MGEKLDKEELVKRLQKGLISDEEVRVLMREQLQKRLQWGYKATHEEQLPDLVSFAKSLRKMGITEETEDLDLQLYELPISFYALVRGDKRKQSVCHFDNDSATLDEAETAIFELYCKRAQLMDGQKILDLGCACGALTLYIARKYEHRQITAVTNSKIQTNFILEQCSPCRSRGRRSRVRCWSLRPETYMELDDGRTIIGCGLADLQVSSRLTRATTLLSKYHAGFSMAWLHCDVHMVGKGVG